MTESPHRRLSLLLLAACGLFFFAGLHRLATQRYVSGIIMLMTLGLFGIGTVTDLLFILLGHFRDAKGLCVKRWY